METIEKPSAETIQKIAALIESIKRQIFLFSDALASSQEQKELLKAMIEKVNVIAGMMRDQANKYDSCAAIIGGGYTPKQSQLLFTQAAGVKALAEFMESLLKSQKLKDEIAEERRNHHNVLKTLGLDAI